MGSAAAAMAVCSAADDMSLSPVTTRSTNAVASPLPPPPPPACATPCGNNDWSLLATFPLAAIMAEADCRTYGRNSGHPSGPSSSRTARPSSPTRSPTFVLFVHNWRLYIFIFIFFIVVGWVRWHQDIFFSIFIRHSTTVARPWSLQAEQRTAAEFHEHIPISQIMDLITPFCFVFRQRTCARAGFFFFMRQISKILWYTFSCVILS